MNNAAKGTENMAVSYFQQIIICFLQPLVVIHNKIKYNTQNRQHKNKAEIHLKMFTKKCSNHFLYCGRYL